jgi:dsRNA-specific ribonuclease
LQRLVLGYYRVNTALDRYLQYTVDERPDLRGRVRATVTIVLDLPTAGNDAYRVLRFTGQRDTNQRTAEQTAAMMALPKGSYYFEMRTRMQQQRQQHSYLPQATLIETAPVTAVAVPMGQSLQAAIAPGAGAAVGAGAINYKNILQEWAQSRYRGMRPVEDVLVYSPAPPVAAFSGGFRSQVTVQFPNGQQGVYVGEQMAGTKKASEQEAARVALSSGLPEFAGLCPGLSTSLTTSSATAAAPSHAPSSAPYVAAASSIAGAGASPYTTNAYTSSSTNSASMSAPSGNYKDVLQRWMQAMYRNRLPIEICLIYDVYAVGTGGFQASLQVLVNEATGEYLSFRSTAIFPTKKLAEQDVAMLALQHPRFSQNSSVLAMAPAALPAPAALWPVSPPSVTSAVQAQAMTSHASIPHASIHTPHDNENNGSAEVDRADNADDGVGGDVGGRDSPSSISSVTINSTFNFQLSSPGRVAPVVSSSVQAHVTPTRPAVPNAATSAFSTPGLGQQQVHMQVHMPMPVPMPTPTPPPQNQNYKNLLQDWAQSQYRNTRQIADVIRYEPIVPPQALPSLQPAFQCKVQVVFPDGQAQTFYGVQIHTTKKAAEQEAARVALYSGHPHFHQLVSRLPR